MAAPPPVADADGNPGVPAVCQTTVSVVMALGLGKAVVTNRSVPADVREGLNVESGLNDGI